MSVVERDSSNTDKIIISRDAGDFSLEYKTGRREDTGFTLATPDTVSLNAHHLDRQRLQELIPDFIPSLQESLPDIATQMRDVISNRLNSIDNNADDQISVNDIQRVREGFVNHLDHIDGSAGEVIDALSVVLMHEVLSNAENVSDEARQFLAQKQESDLQLAGRVLEPVNIDPNEAVTPVIADQELPAPTALQRSIDLVVGDEVISFSNFDDLVAHFVQHGSFEDFNDFEVTREIAEALAITVALIEPDPDNPSANRGVEGYEEKTLEEVSTSPEYIAVINAFEGTEITPQLQAEQTLTAYRRLNDLVGDRAAGDTLKDGEVITYNDFKSLCEHFEQNNNSFEGFEGEITAEMAEAVAIFKALEDPSRPEQGIEGAREATLVETQQDAEYIAVIQAHSAFAQPQDTVREEPVNVQPTGEEPAAYVHDADQVTTIQRFAQFAKDGGYAALQDVQISAIDGQAGARTANSLAAMLNKDVSDLGRIENEILNLGTQMLDDPAFRTAVLRGLDQALAAGNTADVAGFLQAVDSSADLSNLENALNAYKDSLPGQAALDSASPEPSSVQTIAEAAPSAAPNPALTDGDRILHRAYVRQANELVEANGGELPEAGMIDIMRGRPVLVRQIEGPQGLETIATQIHRENAAELLANGPELSAELKQEFLDQISEGAGNKTHLQVDGLYVAVNSETGGLDFSNLSITESQGRGLRSIFVGSADGSGQMFEVDELADGLDRYDGTVGDRGEHGEALDNLERAVRRGEVTGIFVDTANEVSEDTVAVTAKGLAEPIIIPQELVDRILDAADTRKSPAVEVSAPQTSLGIQQPV